MFNSKFIGNNAERGGAIYQKGNISLHIENSIFKRNTANIAGVLLMDCEFYTGCESNITLSYMEDNFAEIAPIIMSKGIFVHFTNNSLNNNSDNIGFATDKISVFPLKLIVLGNSEIDHDIARGLIKDNYHKLLWEEPQVIVSGWEFNTSLALTDSQLNLLNFDEFSRASLQSASDSVDKLIIENPNADCSKGLFKFKNVKIITNPNSSR